VSKRAFGASCRIGVARLIASGARCALFDESLISTRDMLGAMFTSRVNDPSTPGRFDG